jgi:hypothetical protein
VTEDTKETLLLLMAEWIAAEDISTMIEIEDKIREMLAHAKRERDNPAEAR